MKKFLFSLIGAFMLFSVASAERPPVIDQTTNLYQHVTPDLFTQPVIIENVFSFEVASSNIITYQTSYAESPPECPGSDYYNYLIEKECQLLNYNAIMPLSTHYRKKAFISHNKDINRWHKQMYGITKDRDQVKLAHNYVPSIASPYKHDRPAWLKGELHVLASS